MNYYAFELFFTIKNTFYSFIQVQKQFFLQIVFIWLQWIQMQRIE